MGRKQEADTGHRQMTLYSGCRGKIINMMKLRDWLTGILEERRHINLLKQMTAHE